MIEGSARPRAGMANVRSGAKLLMAAVNAPAGGGGRTAAPVGDGQTAALQAGRPGAPPHRVISPIELVERARNRDRDAFEALYRLQFPSIARQATALVRDATRAEDVVAQTFFLAWRDLPQLRRADRFDSWLARIAHHQAISELRRRQTAPLEDAPEPADPSEFGSPGQLLDREADVDRLRAALLQLPNDQRAVLMLRFLRDLPHVEVARLLGRSEQATRALQYRALRSMQRLIEVDEP